VAFIILEQAGYGVESFERLLTKGYQMAARYLVVSVQTGPNEICQGCESTIYPFTSCYLDMQTGKRIVASSWSPCSCGNAAPRVTTDSYIEQSFTHPTLAECAEKECCGTWEGYADLQKILSLQKEQKAVAFRGEPE
jgi:hypothetical protein